MHWTPDKLSNHNNSIRRVGVEIEFSGLTLEKIAEAIIEILGGELVMDTRLEARVVNTTLGDFVVELDAQYFKDLLKSKQAQDISTEKGSNADDTLNFLEHLSMEIIPENILAKAAAQFVPWEIVSPPVPMDQIHKLAPLMDRLRKMGALGTRHSPLYAFGVHLNPELPDLSSDTVLRYLQAYFCLYEWIADQEDIDLARRITPYINHFEKKYVEKVIAKDYHPTLDGLIDDYLKYNPTRNRSMDLLPLFSYFNQEKVQAKVQDARVKSRPTFHFRLPNCDIDNPSWNLDVPWKHWLAIEALANEPSKLSLTCEKYLNDLQRLTRSFDSKWIEHVEAKVLTPLKGEK